MTMFFDDVAVRMHIDAMLRERDKVVTLLCPKGYTPPYGAESNSHTKKVKARKKAQAERMRSALREIASTFDWATHPGSVEWRVHKLALHALNPSHSYPEGK